MCRIEGQDQQEELPEEQSFGAFSLPQTTIDIPWAFDDVDVFNDPLFQMSDTPAFAGSHNGYSYPMNQITPTFLITDMGPANFQDKAGRGHVLVKSSHGQLRRTNSVFSDHFNAVEFFLRQEWSNSETVWNNDRDEGLVNP
jgi:hypothetical protein